MNSDFRIKSDWYRNPNIVKLRRRLGAEGVLGLVTLWTWMAEVRPDGIFLGLDDEDVAICAGYPDDPKAFVDTLVALRLLCRDEDGTLSIPGCEDGQS